MQYKVKYWLNIDVLAEEIVESDNINIDTDDDLRQLMDEGMMSYNPDLYGDYKRKAPIYYIMHN